MGPRGQPTIGNNKLPPFATTSVIRQIGAICGALRLVDDFVNDSRALLVVVMPSVDARRARENSGRTFVRRDNCARNLAWMLSGSGRCPGH
jgi:hypothetical protein